MKKKDKILPTKHYFHEVNLLPGKYTVKFIYNPLSFRIGMFISLFTIIGIVSFFLINWRYENKIFQNELLIAIVWSVFKSYYHNPILYCFYIYSKNMCFMGFFEGSFDQNSYLGWIKQGVEGNILFKNLYTVQEQSNNFFHPLFYLMGKFIKLINSNVTDGYHIFRIITGFLLLLLIYYFIRIFIEEKIGDYIALF